jgi:hypothetical protein
MNAKQTAIVKSYLRGALVAVVPLVATNNTDAWAYAFALVAGVISPALRALDKSDATFGLVADVLETKVKKKVK